MTKKKGKVKVILTYTELTSEFHPSITHLGALAVKEIDALMAIVRAKKITDEKNSEFYTLRKKVVEADCLRDKEGKPILENGMYTYKDENMHYETEERLKELENKKITLELTPISVKVLKGVENMTANTIVGLREFIQEE